MLGGGGYVAGPAGLAASSLRLPLVLTEADRHLGLTNRLLARRARRVCLAFPIPGRDGDRYLVTGRPVPAAVLGADRDAARSASGSPPTTAACSSSAAARARARSTSPRSRPSPARARTTATSTSCTSRGSRDHARSPPAARRRRRNPPRYTLLEYEPDLADALAAADLVLARSGGSIFEIAAAGRPAILVPYPHATGRHQHANAEWMADGRRRRGDRGRRARPGAACGVLAGELLGDPDRLRGDGGRGDARSPAPTPPRRVAAEVLAAIGQPVRAMSTRRRGAAASCTSSRSAAPG